VNINTLIESEITNTYQLIAVEQYSQAETRAYLLLEKQPNNPKIYELIGNINFEQKKYSKSIWYFCSALETNPHNADLLNKFGENLSFLKKYKHAEACIRQAIALEPKASDFYVSLGLNFQEQNNLKEAQACFEQAIEIDPKEVFAYLNLALIHKRNRNYEEAIAVYQKAMVKNPDNHFILTNLGNLFYLKKKYDDAILCHKRATKLMPDSPVVLLNYANTLLASGNLEQSTQICREIIKLDPTFAKSHVQLAHNLLLQKQFDEGFKELRWHTKVDEKLTKFESFKSKLWTGQSLSGKTILVCAESGFGDVFLFARYLESIKIQNCKIIFAVQNSLQHFFKDLKYIDKLISIDQEPEDFDYYCPLMSLAEFISPNPTQQCPAAFNINVNEQKLSEWEILMKLDHKVRVGLCWHGSFKNPKEHLNSINLSLFKNLFKIPNTKFISLQKGEAREQILKYNLARNLIDYDPLMDNGKHAFLDTAAIIKLLDVVITVDTSIAHLAASLGKTTWILLPKSNDWRWFQNTDESIWYDNARLFRQNDAATWDNVVTDIERELSGIVSNIFEVRKSSDLIF
jgi:tetratricopeptide (TPR) repeat protein